MAQIDAFRFLRNVAMLLAPNIKDGQEFIAYVDEDNEFTVLADNIIKASGGGGESIDTAQVQEIAGRISALKSQADEIEAMCSNVPALLTQIETLSGSTEAEGTIDFEWAFLSEQVNEMKEDICNIKVKLREISTIINSLHGEVISENNIDFS